MPDLNDYHTRLKLVDYNFNVSISEHVVVLKGMGGNLR